MTESKPHDYHPPHLDSLRRFSELATLEIADPQQRVTAFQELSAEEFLDILAVSNGLLRGEQKFQRWQGKAAHSSVKNRSLREFEVWSPELDPPAHADTLFSELFSDIQQHLDVSQDSINEASVRLFFGIVGAHMFTDGNGRLARSAYFAMKHGKLPEDTKILERDNSSAAHISEIINIRATEELMLEEGLPEDRVAAKEFMG